MKELIIKNGGITVQNNKVLNAGGWCVGIGNLYTGTIENYNWDNLPSTFGAWLDNNILYIVIINNKDEAIKLAKQNNELAIYHLSNKETFSILKK